MSEDLFSYPFESKALSILKRALGNPEAKFREDQLFKVAYELEKLFPEIKPITPDYDIEN